MKEENKEYLIVAKKKDKKEVKKNIYEQIFNNILRQLKEKMNPHLYIPIRTKSTIIYDEKESMIFLRKKLAKRDFLNLKNIKKFTQTLAVSSTIHELLRREIHAQLRDVFYTRAYIFEDQSQSDAIVEDLSVLLGVSRENLNIIASAKGVCVGDLIIEDKGDLINCSKLGTGGWSISPLIDEIEFKDCGAESVLVIEKDAAFFRLVEDKFWKKNKCILVTGKGQADLATRRFVKRLNEELKLPVYLLVDSVEGETPILVRRQGRISLTKIGSLIDGLLGNNCPLARKIPQEKLEVLCLDIKTREVRWKPIIYVYKHVTNRSLYLVRTKNGKEIIVTGSHSLYVYKNGEITTLPTHMLKKGDFLVTLKGSLEKINNARGKKASPEEIARVEVIGPEKKPMYDISVEGQKFISGEGILCHNSDPYGFYIASVYKRGSIALSFDTPRLATKNARLLGLLPSDLDKYGVPQYARLKMSESDLKRLQEVKKYPWFQKDSYQKEFEIMEKTGQKAELQALCSKNITYISDVYLPRKIKEEDWLE